MSSAALHTGAGGGLRGISSGLVAGRQPPHAFLSAAAAANAAEQNVQFLTPADDIFGAGTSNISMRFGPCMHLKRRRWQAGADV
jgi:hypothetical protein